jgi:uncharacterized protein (DUF1330 family)
VPKHAFFSGSAHAIGRRNRYFENFDLAWTSSRSVRSRRLLQRAIHSRRQSEENTMHRHIALGLAMVAGAALGAAAVQGLHAQAKPPIYYISEIDAPNMDAYVKEYAPLAQKTIRDAGGRIVAAGLAKSVEGEPPKARVAIQIWDSPEKMMAWRNSADYKKAREVGNKLAKFRSFYVEGN